MARYKRPKQAQIAYIAYQLGKNNTNMSIRFPVAQTVKEIESPYYTLDNICKIARVVGMDIAKKHNVWCEHGEEISYILRKI